jgi:hypothetical protein
LKEVIVMVSNTFARSLGYGGSAKIKGRSISEGGGSFSAPDHSGDQGSLKGAAVPAGKPKTSKANAAVGAKGVDCPKALKDTGGRA